MNVIYCLILCLITTLASAFIVLLLFYFLDDGNHFIIALLYTTWVLFVGWFGSQTRKIIIGEGK
jgi:hypothetical protein